jgi:hypothetical protein
MVSKFAKNPFPDNKPETYVVTQSNGFPVGLVFHRSFGEAEACKRRCEEHGMTELRIHKLLDAKLCRECPRAAITWHFTGYGYCKLHSL